MKAFLDAWREQRARRAIAKARKLVGAKVVASWFLEDALAGSECPFGCLVQIEQLRAELAETDRECRNLANALAVAKSLRQTERALLQQCIAGLAAAAGVGKQAGGESADQVPDVEGGTGGPGPAIRVEPAPRHP